MLLRILGAMLALALCLFAFRRYRRGELRRGETALIALVALALAAAAAAPGIYDPLLSALGFEQGAWRRLLGLLVISNLLTLILVFRGFARDDALSNEVGALVDQLALARFRDNEDPLPRGGVVVVLPAHDEADNLPWVLQRMPQEVLDHTVTAVVIADGCTDATEEVARANGARVIRRDLRRGSGAAVRLGYAAALQAGAEVVATLDADGQHDPLELARLVEPCLDGSADIVQGSRVLGTFEIESAIRSRGVILFARLLSFLARIRITDPSTGYRAATAAALARLDLRQDQFYVSEVILEAARRGLVIKEVPITLRARASGVTKKPPPLRYAWGFSKTILRTWLR